MAAPHPLLREGWGTRAGRSPWLIWAGLFAAVLLAAGLRLDGLGDQAYWLDELHSMVNSAGRRGELEALPHGVILDSVPRFTDLTPQSTLSAVWRTMEHDSHPPIYFSLLLGWRRLWGDGEFATRSLAALCSVLSILPVALIFREYRRSRLAFWAVLLLALSYSHIHMGQQNRPYSLGLFLVSLSFWFLVKLEMNWACLGPRRRVLWALLYSASMYFALLTHYFTLLPLVAQVVYVVVRFRGALLRAWWAMVALAAVAWTLTWGRQFVGQWDFIAGQDWLLEQRASHPVRTALRFTDLPLRLLLGHERFTFSLAKSLGGLILMLGSLWFMTRCRRGKALLFALWYVVPVAAFVVIDLAWEKQLLSHIRYSLIAVPGLVGLLILVGDSLPRVLRWAALGVFILGAAITLELPTQTNPLCRRAASLIETKIRSEDLLVYDAIDWPPFWASRLYLIVSYYLPAPHPSFVMLRERPGPDLIEQMVRFDRILVVSPRIGEIPNPLPERFDLAQETGYVRGVGRIYMFIRGPGEQ